MEKVHHAAFWVDHNEARAIAIDDAGFRVVGHVHSHDTHTHPTKVDGHRHPLDRHFVSGIEALLATCEKVVLFGPSQAKDELVRHLKESGSPLGAKIVRVETLDHIGDGPLAAHAREIFRATDRMAGIHVG